jgi:hypothetical protein
MLLVCLGWVRAFIVIFMESFIDVFFILGEDYRQIQQLQYPKYGRRLDISGCGLIFFKDRRNKI